MRKGLIPYSGFLSQVKTFTKFVFLWRFAKVLSATWITATCRVLADDTLFAFFQRADSVFGPASAAVPLSTITAVKKTSGTTDPGI